MDLFRHLPAELKFAIVEKLDLLDLLSLHQVLQALPPSCSSVAITVQTAKDVLYRDYLLGSEDPWIYFSLKNYISTPGNPESKAQGNPRSSSPFKKTLRPTRGGPTEPERRYYSLKFMLSKDMARVDGRRDITRVYEPLSDTHFQMTVRATQFWKYICSMTFTGPDSAAVKGTSIKFPLGHWISPFLWPHYIELRYWQTTGPAHVEDIELKDPPGIARSRTISQELLLTGAWLFQRGEGVPLPVEWFDEMGLWSIRFTIKMRKWNLDMEGPRTDFRLNCVDVEFTQGVELPAYGLRGLLPFWGEGESSS